MANEPALTFFAITAPGIEQITAAELRALNVQVGDIERGGVTFTGALADLYAANLWLRTASRILVRVASFRAATFFELERRARRVPWSSYVASGQGVRFRVTCRKSRLYHSDAVAQRLAAAAGARSFTVERRAEAHDDAVEGRTPASADEDDRQLFIVRLDHDVVTISADSSGPLLHRRGYRQATARAPMRETLAAAMLLASGWDPHTPLLDPMCGSGTIPIEAALIARNIAPGAARSFAFQRWPGFDAGPWRSLLGAAREAALVSALAPILASDRDAGAMRATLENAERAGVAADIQIATRSISAIAPPVAPLTPTGAIVTNPPYGVRVGDSSVRDLYARFGQLLRAHFSGWRVTILTADPRLASRLAVPLERLFETSNGGIPVRCDHGVVPEPERSSKPLRKRRARVKPAG